jgi:hypothetical protein
VLQLMGCRCWTDDAVAVLLPRLGHSLLFLDLLACPQISSVGLYGMLQFIQVSLCIGCCSYTHQTIEKENAIERCDRFDQSHLLHCM